MENRKLYFRILDANFNRLREALRVIEEYYRFVLGHEVHSVELKKIRHELAGIGNMLGKDELLENRDTTTDCFAGENRPEELERDGIMSLLAANFKRGQEAARVIEEYSKLLEVPEVSGIAKTIRFTLYSLEKELFCGKKNE